MAFLKKSRTPEEQAKYDEKNYLFDIIKFKGEKMKEVIKKLVDEFNEFFDATSEYGIGYLDALTEVCQRDGIPHKRLADNLIIE